MNGRIGNGCGAIIAVFLLLGIASCVFGRPQGGAKSDAVATTDVTNFVDAPFLASDPGLKEAHDMEGAGDGFREIIIMKHRECSKSLSAMRTAPHQYQVICSDGPDNGKPALARFMVDTDTGDSQRF